MEYKHLDTDPLIQFCRQLPGASESIKWKCDLIFSVGDKMFAGFDLPEAGAVGFKAAEALFEHLTAQEGIIPSKYMARYFWVDIPDRTHIDPEMLMDLIAQSHQLVAQKLSKKKRLSLGVE